MQMIFDLKHNTRLFPTVKSQLFNVMKTHSQMADVKKIALTISDIHMHRY